MAAIIVAPGRDDEQSNSALHFGAEPAMRRTRPAEGTGVFAMPANECIFCWFGVPARMA